MTSHLNGAYAASAPDPLADGASHQLEHRADASALAWTALHAAHDVVARALEHELTRRHGIGLSAYNVLACLVHSRQDGVRMSALAADVALSLSRVSRLVGELEARGHLERRTYRSDGRVVTAIVTASGRRLWVDLDRTYRRALNHVLADRLDADDLDALLRIWSKLRHPTTSHAPMPQRALGSRRRLAAAGGVAVRGPCGAVSPFTLLSSDGESGGG